MKTLVIALVLAASTAHAYPVFVEPEDPAEREPLTKLGWRLAFAHLPLDATALTGIGVALGVDHEVWGELRVIAEYEWLRVFEVPRDLEMPPFEEPGMAHRTYLGIRRTVLAKSIDRTKFYLDAEAGGGLGIYDAPSGVAMLPHGFVGLRGGWQMTKRRARASRTFETEVQFRAVVVEHGIGFGGGLGFWWGD